MYNSNSIKRNLLVFKHFSHKKYALFACVGKEVKISVLAVCVLTYANVNCISAQTYKADTTTAQKELTLEEVVVTGSRAPMSISQSARMVTVLDRSDIAAAPVQSVNDLLKYAVGVDVRQRGAIGAQTDISVRGGTNEQITILLNGINICDPQTGHNVFELPVDISEIERIEILEGPAGRVYGTSSLVGAINIVTKIAANSSVDVHIKGGSYGYLTTGGRANVVSGKWNNQISANYTKSDGYTRAKGGNLNSDYEGGRVFYQGNYNNENIKVNWHAGMTTKGFGSNTFYSSKFDNQYEHVAKIMTALQAETKGVIHFRPSIYWNRNYDRFELIRGSEAKYKFNYNRTDVFGLNLNSYFDWTLGRTAFGGEFRNEDLISGNLGEPLNKTRHIHGTDRNYTLGLNRSNLSIHLEHNIILNRFTLSAGVIAVKNTWNEMNFQFYPGADVSYRLGSGFSIYASYNTSLRMPSFTELYYSLGGYKADKYLKPEEMTSLEGGLRYCVPGIEAKASVYHHHGKNMIDWIKNTSKGSDAEWESVNHSKVNALGFEVSSRFNLRELFPAQNVFNSFQVAYSYINQDKDIESNYISHYALEYLRHKLVSKLNLHIYKLLNFSTSYRYQYRIGNYTDTQGNSRQLKPYSLVDARLSWDAPKYALYIEGNNILNKTYYDYGDVPQPGFWFMAGGSIHFNL
ncbi:MAG: TonB-dependent receptor plug domain-containing protein [Phocaeicola sp.]|uniref:TonB-dependent receptor plug domain-containing protein n=1 Tax=Phocaeicola sp. TaxID=2773926 RepID=UPI003FA0E032